jgi:hypothetical protein
MRQPGSTRLSQTGISLIGMMIGLLISLLAILGLLAIYKLVIDVSANSVGTSRRDGQLAAALLNAQVELQQAGYGIVPNPAPADTTLLSITAPSSGATQVVWRFRPDLSTDTCAGLRLSPTGSDVGLRWLPPQACTNASAATWTLAQTQLLASSAIVFTPQARDGSALGETGAAQLVGAQFVLDGSCITPYAQQTLDASSVYLLAQRLVLRGGDGTTLFSACLSNIAISQHTP